MEVFDVLGYRYQTGRERHSWVRKTVCDRVGRHDCTAVVLGFALDGASRSSGIQGVRGDSVRASRCVGRSVWRTCLYGGVLFGWRCGGVVVLDFVATLWGEHVDGVLVHVTSESE